MPEQQGTVALPRVEYDEALADLFEVAEYMPTTTGVHLLDKADMYKAIAKLVCGAEEGERLETLKAQEAPA
jgi:hypothetical protein